MLVHIITSRYCWWDGEHLVGQW